MDVLSLNELKSLCQQRKLPISGTKEMLIERLTKGASTARSNSSSSSVPAPTGDAPPPVPSASTGPSVPFSGDYESLTITQLKDLCRERMLAVGGIKDDLVKRLNDSDPQKMSLSQLKEHCREAGLHVTGTKAALADRVLKNMTSGVDAVLQSKSVDELKELCREHGVAVMGKKDELIERIKQATSKTKKTTERTSSAKDLMASTGAAGSAPLKKKSSVPDYASMTVPQLKEICRERSLALGGTKDEIVERLLQAPATASTSRPSSASGKRPSVVASASAAPSSTTADSYESMTIPQLKSLCRERTLPAMGNKDELVKRLNDHDDVIRTMFKKSKPSSTPSTAKSSSTKGVKRSASSMDEPKPKKAKTVTTSSDEPKAKKAKKTVVAAAQEPDAFTGSGQNRARKSTGDTAPRVDLAQRAARKSPPEEWRAVASGRYVVFSSFVGQGGGRPQAKLYESYNLAQAANARAEAVFYEQNPWEMHRFEMDDEDVLEEYEEDLLQLKVSLVNKGIWFVGVQDRGAAASSVPAEPKAKKAKSTLTNAQEPKAKKGSAAREKKSSGGEQLQTGRYQVYSTCAYPRDDFHTYAGPGEPTYYDSYNVAAIANKRVTSVFFGKNPWGLRREEMDDLDVDEEWPGGLLRLSVCPPDREEWTVGVKDHGSAADQDGDVIMVSSSETEDEAYD